MKIYTYDNFFHWESRLNEFLQSLDILVRWQYADSIEFELIVVVLIILSFKHLFKIVFVAAVVVVFSKMIPTLIKEFENLKMKAERYYLIPAAT